MMPSTILEFFLALGLTCLVGYFIELPPRFVKAFFILAFMAILSRDLFPERGFWMMMGLSLLVSVLAFILDPDPSCFGVLLQ